jgi:hypothetical protein
MGSLSVSNGGGIGSGGGRSEGGFGAGATAPTDTEAGESADVDACLFNYVACSVTVSGSQYDSKVTVTASILNSWAEKIALSYSMTSLAFRDSRSRFGWTARGHDFKFYANGKFFGNQNMMWRKTCSVGSAARAVGVAGAPISLYADIGAYRRGEISGIHATTNIGVLTASLVYARSFGPYGLAYAIQDHYNNEVGQLTYGFAMWIGPDIEVPFSP